MDQQVIKCSQYPLLERPRHIFSNPRSEGTPAMRMRGPHTPYPTSPCSQACPCPRLTAGTRTQTVLIPRTLQSHQARFLLRFPRPTSNRALLSISLRRCPHASIWCFPTRVPFPGRTPSNCRSRILGPRGSHLGSRSMIVLPIQSNGLDVQLDESVIALRLGPMPPPTPVK
jgi:hypothetical protein